jgi:hypothetical protein
MSPATPTWWSWCNPCRACINFSPPPARTLEKTLHARQIEAKDRQIDALVYELYGLTEEEIGIVEAGAK